MFVREYRKIKTIPNFEFNINSSFFGTDIFNSVVIDIWDLLEIHDDETPNRPYFRDYCWVKLIFNETQLGSMIKIPLLDKEERTVISEENVKFEYNYDELKIIDFVTNFVNRKF